MRWDLDVSFGSSQDVGNLQMQLFASVCSIRINEKGVTFPMFFHFARMIIHLSSGSAAEQ